MRVLLLMVAVASAGPAQQIDTTFRVPAVRTIEMNGVSGSVEIRAWARAEIRVQVRGAGASRVQVQATASRVLVQERVVLASEVVSRVPLPSPPVNTDTGAVRDTTTLNVRRGQGFWVTMAIRPPPPATVDYVITIPERGVAIVRGNTVDIAVAGTLDTLVLSNVQGTIRAANVRGHVTLSSLEGRVLAEGVRGDLYVRTLSGSITVRDTEGSVEAQGVSGAIDLTDVRAQRVSASTYEGGINLQGALHPNGVITLSTRSGPIGLPTEGPCSELLPGAKLVTITPAGHEQFNLRLTTSTDSSAGVIAGPLTCTLRRH